MSHGMQLSLAARSLITRLQSMESKRDNMLTRLSVMIQDPTVSTAYSRFAELFEACDLALQNRLPEVSSESCDAYHDLASHLAATQQALIDTLAALKDRLGQSPVFSSLLDIESEFIAERNGLRNIFAPISLDSQDLVNQFDLGLAEIRRKLRLAVEELDEQDEISYQWKDEVRALQRQWTDVQLSLKLSISMPASSLI